MSHMSFDPNNCALGAACTCNTAVKYWDCPNWGRSSLAAPRIGHTEAHYTGKPPAQVMKELDDRKRKFDKWNKTTNKKLREVRHSDPVKHLERKGAKIK